MPLTKLLVPTYTQMLKTLSAWLRKAREQMPKAEAEALLSARLAPDMFPLSTQVRFTCLQVQETVFRLRGEAFPESLEELLDEGRKAGELPGSLSDAQSRIDEAIALLESLPDDAFDVGLDKSIAHELPDGRTFDLTAEQYVRDWALPQFYFHLVTAYAILRSRSVELGKADYVPHMFAYLRSETVPKG